jgi:hypothetical protein
MKTAARCWQKKWWCDVHLCTSTVFSRAKTRDEVQGRGIVLATHRTLVDPAYWRKVSSTSWWPRAFFFFFFLWRAWGVFIHRFTVSRADIVYISFYMYQLPTRHMMSVNVCASPASVFIIVPVWHPLPWTLDDESLSSFFIRLKMNSLQTLKKTDWRKKETSVLLKMIWIEEF